MLIGESGITTRVTFGNGTLAFHLHGLVDCNVAMSSAVPLVVLRVSTRAAGNEAVKPTTSPPNKVGRYGTVSRGVVVAFVSTRTKATSTVAEELPTHERALTIAGLMPGG